MAAKRKSSAFIKVANSSPSGIVAFNSSHILSMRWFTSVAFEPGAWKISMKVPGSPLTLETKLYDFAPISISATSLRCST